MFREMRREGRQLGAEGCMEILRKGEHGVLSTVSDNGYAYGVPLNYVYKGDSIYFHCAVEGHKLDNLRNKPKVSFCVIGEAEVLADKFTVRYESVIVFGKATEVDKDEKCQALVSLLEKYASAYMPEGRKCIENAGDKTRVVKISVECMTGKGSR